MKNREKGEAWVFILFLIMLLIVSNALQDNNTRDTALRYQKPIPVTLDTGSREISGTMPIADTVCLSGNQAPEVIIDDESTSERQVSVKAVKATVKSVPILSDDRDILMKRCDKNDQPLHLYPKEP